MNGSRLNSTLRAIAAALLSALLPGMVAAGDGDTGAPAKPEDSRWRVVLGQQLKAEKTCDLLNVLVFNEMPLGDYVSISGRIACLDGREFDFSRKQPHQKFEINLCQPTVC